MTDVCFVLMPYVGVEHPSIAIGLLKACLTRSGINSHAIYANIWFAEEIGIQSYYSVDGSNIYNLLGEWTFAEAAFPDFHPNHDEYFRLCDLPEDNNLLSVEKFWEIRKKATQFVDKVAKAVIDLNPRIVSCSSTFQQHCPSLALLRRIKELAPEMITLMGGANCEGIMGVTTHRVFPWVDFVASGEGDEYFADLCHLLMRQGRDVEPEQLPYGVIGPKSRGQCIEAPRASVHNLNNVPIPDYDEYFETLNNSSIAPVVTPGLLVETSRGCWWGQKSQCTFCGLNGHGMNYRAKSPDRVIEEFAYLSERYHLRKFEVVDNILATSYFDDVLPILANQKEPYDIFYETKSDLQYSYIEKLSQAGIHWIQPGIESLHDSILKLMRKGTIASLNVQLLKWSREFGIRLSWNVLCDFPGESDEWYQEMSTWLPLICHLQPPSGMIKVKYHRFSPYHDRPNDFGLELLPLKNYSYIYPLSQEEITDLAYFFVDIKDIRHPSGEKSFSPEKEKVNQILMWWHNIFYSSQPPLLCMQDQDRGLQIIDTRPIAKQRTVYLTGLERAIYLACEQALTSRQLIKILDQSYDLKVSWNEIESVIKSLKEQRTLLEISGRYLSLAVRGLIPALPKNHDFPGGSFNTNFLHQI